VSKAITLVLEDDSNLDIWKTLEAVIQKAGASVHFSNFVCQEGDVDDAVVGAIRETGVALMGFQWGQREAGKLPPIVQLRKALGTHTCLRPIRSLPGIESVWEGVDLWMVRETTEDIYAHLEHESLPGVFESVKVTTQAACERICREAFELARAKGRKKVTTVHKSNIMKLSDGMFLRVSKAVAKDYPDIAHDEVIVDALCMKLVLNPNQFDVLVCGNLFGDIVGDLCAGLVGGPANAPSINLGDDVAVFTTGQSAVVDDRTDAFPLLLSALYMLEHLGELDARARLGAAAEGAVADGIVPILANGDADWNTYLDAVSARLG